MIRTGCRNQNSKPTRKAIVPCFVSKLFKLWSADNTKYLSKIYGEGSQELPETIHWHSKWNQPRGIEYLP